MAEKKEITIIRGGVRRTIDESKLSQWKAKGYEVLKETKKETGKPPVAPAGGQGS